MAIFKAKYASSGFRKRYWAKDEMVDIQRTEYLDMLEKEHFEPVDDEAQKMVSDFEASLALTEQSKSEKTKSKTTA